MSSPFPLGSPAQRRKSKLTHRIVIAAASIAMFIATLFASSPASATPTTELPADARAVLTALAQTNVLTDQGRGVLLKYPELARVVIDPGLTTFGSSTGALDGASITTAYSGCRYFDAYANGYTALGILAYRFHQRMSYCYNGSTVTSVFNRYVYMSNTDGFHFYRGLITNSYNKPPTSKVTSTTQGTVENCIFKYGCISVEYPYVQIRAYGSGSAYYTAYIG